MITQFSAGRAVRGNDKEQAIITLQASTQTLDIPVIAGHGLPETFFSKLHMIDCMKQVPNGAAAPG